MKLYPHQKTALDETKNRNRVAYYLDMGLGKTFVGSEKMFKIGARNNLIVCQKSKVDDWVQHIGEHYCHCASVFDLTTKKGLLHFFDRDFVGESTRFVGVINYELVFRRPQLLDLDDITLMLDESSIIQNSSTKAWKFIKKLDTANVILLSGTPCSGKYENLWTQAHLLGWDIDEKTFLKHYINFRNIDTPVGIKKIVDKRDPYKNQDRLKSKFRAYGAVFMKTDEVFDLPEQTIIDIKVSKSKEYDEFIKNEIVTVEGNDLVGNTQLAKLLYARALCGAYSSAKFDAFRDLLTSTNDRLIVFYNFNQELERLTKIAGECGKPVSQVNGHIKDLSAYEDEDDSVTFVQYQAGAKGLNLQKANKIIYFTPTLSVENYMQSQKRIHRIGQTKPCFYYRMICKNTVEKDIYSTLERGIDYTDNLFEGERYGS